MIIIIIAILLIIITIARLGGARDAQDRGGRAEEGRGLDSRNQTTTIISYYCYY